MSIELERAKADRRLILTRQRLLEQVLRAKIEAARNKEGCPDPKCSLCKRKRARVLALERRLFVVLLATMDPRLVRGAREWARRLLEAPRGLRHRRIGIVRPAVERSLDSATIGNMIALILPELEREAADLRRIRESLEPACLAEWTEAGFVDEEQTILAALEAGRARCGL